MSKREYDGTVARIAGNLLAGTPILAFGDAHTMHGAAESAVHLARLIVEETKRTEPATVNPSPPPEDVGGVAKKGI